MAEGGWGFRSSGTWYCHWVVGSWRLEGTPGTDYAVTEHHIQIERNPQTHRFEILKTGIMYAYQIYSQISFNFPEHWFLLWAQELPKNLFLFIFRCQERNTSIMRASSVDFSSGTTVLAYRTLCILLRHEYQWLQTRVRYIHNAGYQFARGSQPKVPPSASKLHMAKICSILICQIYYLVSGSFAEAYICGPEMKIACKL